MSNNTVQQDTYPGQPYDRLFQAITALPTKGEMDDIIQIVHEDFPFQEGAKSAEGWISGEERLPDVGTPVYVKAEYLERGKEMVDYFTAYMDEFGDTIICPTGDSYGWQFNDCVTHWMPLPAPPASPK
jgi:hypothetical protein